MYNTTYQGVSGLSGLTFDGTGLVGTGLFSSDITSWGLPELLAGVIGIYAFRHLFSTARNDYRVIRGKVGKKRLRRTESQIKKLKEKQAKLQKYNFA